MRSAIVVVVSLLALGTPAFGQSSASESQTLQQLLQEVKQLRQDMRTGIVSMQRAQLLFFRMQAQEAVVARAQQRLDSANAALDRAQRMRTGIENEFKYDTDHDTEDATQNAAERQRIEQELPRVKEQLDAAAAAEQQAQGNVMAAKDQLQVEQGKLAELQSELDRIDKSLEQLTKQPGN